ncbi:unnamed protein product [Macrosiphum euphorbiae]|uniref:THAP-type domain-containing protein n=1 Tax=Macrosiphum euphorbiae TaxID=13131 RepID=A0AAV0VPW8_9HEMI|nr:unnamed protein product [Macrosiphum euphorbiae]
MFHPPQNLLSVWNNKIQRKDRNLSIKDVVCGLHFKEDDFLKYECKMPDGSIKYIERIRPALRENAIPTIFLGLPERFSNVGTKRPAPKNRQEIKKRVCNASTSDLDEIKIVQEQNSPNE